MEYTNLGKTGLQISRLSLGSWLTFGKQIGDNTAEVILEELKKLVSEKRKICSPYEQMIGQELIDKENHCKN
ncbi:MAG: hypothetical protein ACKO1R_10530 [Crocinitomicaceae bacterium]